MCNALLIQLKWVIVALFSATQQIPRFVNEIVDTYAEDGEQVIFEVTYSGNPVPDVVWYRNDKLLMNTENVKVKLLDNEKKTTLTVFCATSEDNANYVCKATSDIGLAVTKAKLQVSGILFVLIAICIISMHSKQFIKA